MRFCCTNCNTWYRATLREPSAAGRRMMVRCRKCGSEILLEPEQTMEATELAAAGGSPAPLSYRETRATSGLVAAVDVTGQGNPARDTDAMDLWCAAPDGDGAWQMGSSEVGARIRAGEYTAQTRLWHMASQQWMELGEAPEFSHLWAALSASAPPVPAEEPQAQPPEPPAAATPEADNPSPAAPEAAANDGQPATAPAPEPVAEGPALATPVFAAVDAQPAVAAAPEPVAVVAPAVAAPSAPAEVVVFPADASGFEPRSGASKTPNPYGPTVRDTTPQNPSPQEPKAPPKAAAAPAVAGPGPKAIHVAPVPPRPLPSVRQRQSAAHTPVQAKATTKRKPLVGIAIVAAALAAVAALATSARDNGAPSDGSATADGPDAVAGAPAVLEPLAAAPDAGPSAKPAPAPAVAAVSAAESPTHVASAPPPAAAAVAPAEAAVSPGAAPAGSEASKKAAAVDAKAGGKSATATEKGKTAGDKTGTTAAATEPSTEPAHAKLGESEAIEAGFLRIATGVRMCARAEARRNPEGELGRVDVAVTVTGDGTISKVDVGNIDDSSDLAACIRTAVQRVSFGQIDGKTRILRRSYQLGS